jgi:hypothetical protein
VATRTGRRFRGRPGKLAPGCLDELIAYAEHQFRLARRAPDGATDGDHQASAFRQLRALPGARPADVGLAAALDAEGPEAPSDGAHVWLWFLDLHQGRGSNGFGGSPLSWADIKAWRDLTGTLLRPGEIQAIMALDRAWLAIQAPPEKTPAPAPRAPRR